MSQGPETWDDRADEPMTKGPTTMEAEVGPRAVSQHNQWWYSGTGPTKGIINGVLKQ